MKSKASSQTTDAVAEWQTACETYGFAILSQTLRSVLIILIGSSELHAGCPSVSATLTHGCKCCIACLCGGHPAEVAPCQGGR